MDPQILSQQFIWFLIISIPLLLLLFRSSRKREHAKLPPGPWKLPILGNLHQLGPKPHESLHELYLKHGPLMFLKLGSIPTVVISSGDVAQAVFKAHDAAFSNRPHLYARRKLTYGRSDMVWSNYGEYWKQLRKISMIEVLSSKRVESFRAVREDEVASLIVYIKKLSASSPSATINLSKMMLSLVNNIVCRIMFGDKYIGRISKYDEGGSRFYEILEETMKLLGGFCIADYFPSLEWVHEFTGLKKKLDKNFEDLDSFFSKMIQEHTDNSSDPGHEDLVHVLLRLHNDPTYGATFSTMNSIKGFLSNVFIAGSDTSSMTLVWTMTELMRKPRVVTKLQQELEKVVGSKSMVDESDLQQLDYLKLVIKEGLRLHPPAPLLVPRETTEMCKIKQYHIPAKTRIFVNAKAIARNPQCWDNPDEFWPERFLENARDYRPGQHFDYMPFGVGRRGCPGINLASSIMELTLANLLHCFEWGLPLGMKAEDLDLEETFGLTTPKKNHLCLVAKAKKNLEGLV